jgi:hypothetical protein
MSRSDQLLAALYLPETNRNHPSRRQPMADAGWGTVNSSRGGRAQHKN